MCPRTRYRRLATFALAVVAPAVLAATASAAAATPRTTAGLAFGSDFVVTRAAESRATKPTVRKPPRKPVNKTVRKTPPKPIGNPKAYAFISQWDGTWEPIARWNPCAGPITYRVNLDRAPRNALSDVKGAISRISQATGLRFRYLGTTKVVPKALPGYPGRYPADTQLVIAWAMPGKQSSWMPAHAFGLLGMGGPTYQTARDAKGRPAQMIIQGSVVLNASYRQPSGFGSGSTLGELLMHEIGHAMGLDHPRIQDQTEIMYPVLTGKRAAWGVGDLNGLRLVGSTQGCLYSDDPFGGPPAS